MNRAFYEKLQRNYYVQIEIARGISDICKTSFCHGGKIHLKQTRSSGLLGTEIIRMKHFR